MDELPQGTILRGERPYKIIKKLGQGSFGITYLATMSTTISGKRGAFDTEVKVAIKEFFMRDINGREGTTVTCGSKGGIYDNYKKKFIREARNLGTLQHPNIVKVVEDFEANNTVYFSMEYISGGNLDAYIERKGKLSEGETVRIAKQIGKALSFMHNKHILHLDLKPGNIMMREDGTPVLIDFGLSKQYDKDGNPESSTTVGGGTLGYAPLEQAYHRKGECKDFPMTMDVYAFGATLYKMLTGKRPPEAYRILNDGFPFDQLQGNDVSDALATCIAKAMAPTKKARYQTVEEFITAIEKMGIPTEDDTIIPEEDEDPVVVEVVETGSGPESGNGDKGKKPDDGNNNMLKYITGGIIGFALIIVLAILMNSMNEQKVEEEITTAEPAYAAEEALAPEEAEAVEAEKAEAAEKVEEVAEAAEAAEAVEAAEAAEAVEKVEEAVEKAAEAAPK